MAKQGKASSKCPSELRNRAEQLLRGHIHGLQAPWPEEVEQLVYELEVHQIELEMQNEELRETQQQLEASHDRYVDLYDFAPLGYVTLDGGGRIRQINLAAAKMLNVPRGSLTGRSFVGYVAAEDKNAFLRHVRKCARGDEEATSEVTLATKGGQSIAVQLHSIPAQDTSTGVTLFRTAISDITQHIRHIANAAEKMEQLLEGLLELSRIGRIANPAEEVALGELAREAVDLVGGRIAQRGIEVEISSDQPVLFGDRLRLLQVLQNLIDNAAKFMGDQAQPRIKIGARHDGQGGDETLCYVRDNGVGIDPDHQKRVFGLFDQLDPEINGTGVGLALVKRIIEVHGGRIWVESEGQGRGCTFWFALPLNGESVATERRANKARALSPF